MVGIVFTGLVGLLHLYIMVVEMFLWTKPSVRKRFGLSAEEAELTQVLAANQGIYNGALGGGLIAAAILGDPTTMGLFLGFVVVVGLYGGASFKRSIYFIQALPACIGLALVAGNV